MTSVDLSSNELCGLDKYGRGTYDATGITAIADVLSVSTSMKSIDISRNYLGYGDDMSGVKAIANALNANTSMTKLAIWDNNIGVEGATAIVNAAPAQMRTLCGDIFEEGQTEADFSGKKLGPEGAILVAWDLRAGFVSTSMTSLK